MTITFYSTRSLPSPPARAVEAVIKILNLKVEKRDVDLSANEHLEPWFLKLNPTHQVPVLDDNGFVITDSHAIIAYLFTVYGSKEILEQYYPTDPKQRALIESRLHFEHGVLFARSKVVFLPVLVWGEKEIPLEKIRWVVHGIEFLETFLEGQQWVAGDRLTIADIFTITIIDLLELLVPLKHYKNVSAWVERTRKASPFYNEIGIEELNTLRAEWKKVDYDAEARWQQIQSESK